MCFCKNAAPKPLEECAVDVLYVIGSFAYTAQMLSFTFVDCPQRGGRVFVFMADRSTN